MKRKYRFLVILAVFIIVITPSLLPANSPSAYGPKGRRFGAGLHLGEPTGFTFKGYLNRRLAVDGIFAWSFVDDAFTLIGDATYEIMDIPTDTRAITLPFYVGGGFKVAANAGPSDKTEATIRVPIGVAAQWVRYSVEVFFEIGPGIKVAPETAFDLTGGIGARFYF